MGSIDKPVYSALITGIQAQISDSVLILLGQNKGQFSLEAKETLSRFRPLLERAISDIEHKEELQKLVEIRRVNCVWRKNWQSKLTNLSPTSSR